MSHSHDKTYIASLGFSDPDKNLSEHDLACRYLCEKENVLSLVKNFGTPRRWWEPNPYVAALQECPINQESGSFKRTIGFADVILDCYIPTGRKKEETYGKTVETVFEANHLNALIEVKIKPQSINTAIRQLKFYKTYMEKYKCMVFILATRFKITENDIKNLKENEIEHIFLGDMFTKYLKMSENDKYTEMIEI